MLQSEVGKPGSFIGLLPMMQPTSRIPFLMSLLPFTDIQAWLSSVTVLHLLSVEKEGGEEERGVRKEGEMEGKCGSGEG